MYAARIVTICVEGFESIDYSGWSDDEFGRKWCSLLRLGSWKGKMYIVIHQWVILELKRFFRRRGEPSWRNCYYLRLTEGSGTFPLITTARMKRKLELHWPTFLNRARHGEMNYSFQRR